jgi:ferredoxin
MKEYGKAIQKIAKRLLTEGKVDGFIGYKKGSIPLMNEPVYISDPEKTDILHWDSHCGLNLCNYLTGRKERIGIAANGCISRNIIIHVVENQIQRDQLYIVGVPCSGMIDHRKVQRTVGHKEITEVKEDGEHFAVMGNGFEETFKKKDYLQDNCATCTHRNPVIYDEIIAKPVKEQQGVEAFTDVKEIEVMDPPKKRNFFSQLIEGCIRCYACRDACPLCYCPTCFVDESQPQWVGKSVDPTDTMTFHILRAYHCAGRCTDCGACERVCPMGIPVRQFTKKLNKDALDLYSWEAGVNPDQRPLLDAYLPDDFDEFIK